jgi:hypothetical protein
MKLPFYKIIFIVFVLFVEKANGQSLTQTIRGTIVDQVSQMPLPGANVIILNSDPILGETSDADGNFKISKVPVGSYTLKISFIGYKEMILPNVMVNSGKEVVLQINLEEDVVQMQEIVVTATQKDKTINEMSVVSTRTFSVEETRKFAAAVNDPARMVTSYAGVVSADDGNNSISIRGNSPFGLLWRMEGVDIPNPNHFANAATAGGGISILSSQLLANSDFSTGAFSAEYGNALSGVFDLKLRKGNNEKAEYTVQAGFLGTDVAAEGPLNRNKKGSYLVNYRYSTLSMLSKLGVPLGDFVTNFQDLSFNIHLPVNKNNSVNVFGFGGLSDQTSEAEKDSLGWKDNIDRYNSIYKSNTGAVGIKYNSILSANTFLQNAIVFSGVSIVSEEEILLKDYIATTDNINKLDNSKITWSSVLNHKVNPRLSLHSGFYFNMLQYKVHSKEREETSNVLETLMNSNGQTQTLQAFAQANYKVTDKLTINGGLHYLQLMLNNSYAVEPRLAFQYTLNDVSSVNFGYGLHSQIQPLGTYFGQTEESGITTLPNKNLKLSRAHHFVAGYDRSLTQNLRIKSEIYYQHLFDIPVEREAGSTNSIINQQWGFVTDPMVSKGSGRNYGIEFTLEQFLHNNVYFLLSTSLYESKYKAIDGVWRDTRFNANRNVSFTAGKEFNWKKNRTFGINIRTIYSGGFRTTPVNVAASLAKGETVWQEDKAFSEQVPDYFRTDIRISLKRNRAKSTHTISLDLQNATNRKNVFGEFFDPLTGNVKTAYLTPLIPILAYRVEF